MGQLNHRKPSLMKLRMDCEFPWELAFTSTKGLWKEHKRFTSWLEGIMYMIQNNIPRV